MSKTQIFLLSLVSFVVGVWLGPLIKIGYLILYGAVVILLAAFIVSQHKKEKIIISLIFFLILGYFRYQLSLPKTDETKISFYNGQKITMVGRVSGEPSIAKDKTMLTFSAQTMNGRLVSGKVLVSAPLYPVYHYGQFLEISCRLSEPENSDNFNYHEYLARYDIYSLCSYPQIRALINQEDHNLWHQLYSQILSLKYKFRNLILNNFTEPQGSLLSALLLGLQRDVPQGVNNWFRQTGTSHIVAVSGMHVAIMVQIIEFLAINLLYLSRNKAFYFSGTLIFLYIALVGFPASAVRSGIMAMVALYAKKIGRLNPTINALVLTAALMLLQNPKLLATDVGFQLSFTAILGMTYFSNYFNQKFSVLPSWRFLPLRYLLATTFSAQVFTLPLILHYFGNLSLSAPLANVLVLPAVNFLMICGFIFLIFGIIWFVLAKILAIPVWFLLTYFLMVVKALAGLPYFSYNLGYVSWLIVTVLYILIIFWLIKIRRQKD